MESENKMQLTFCPFGAVFFPFLGFYFIFLCKKYIASLQKSSTLHSKYQI